jgi:integral membrane protein
MSASSPYQPPAGSEPASASEFAPKLLNFRTPVGRVRLVGMAEGLSFLILLGIAMPLKYLAGMPMAVRIVGMAHGVLFILFLLVILQAWGSKALTTKHSALAFLASLIPFGPFLIDRRLAESPAQTGDSAD